MLATVNEQGQQHQQVRCQRSAQLVKKRKKDKSPCTLKLDEIETPVSRLTLTSAGVALTNFPHFPSSQSKSQVEISQSVRVSPSCQLPPYEV